MGRPTPCKLGCVHSNLCLTPDAAGTFLGHSLHSGHSMSSPWLSAQFPPGREDVSVTRPSMIFVDVLGKHLEGVGSAGLSLESPLPGVHGRGWASIP